METFIPKRNIVFFNPGKSGVLFIHPAQQTIPFKLLIKTKECLVKITSSPVVYLTERRDERRY